MVKFAPNAFALLAIDELSPKLPANSSRGISRHHESIFEIGATAMQMAASRFFASRAK
jgi:hypothetical protein